MQKKSNAENLTVVAYHYVRDLKNSKYPEIKGLETALFKEQLVYIQKHYQVIRMEYLLARLEGGAPLPKNSLLLTFDDGYIDHFSNVFPILDKAGLQGTFFPSAEAVEKHKVLDVNKIHFILASVKDKSRIISDIYSEMNEFGNDFSLRPNSYYEKKLAREKLWFDTKEVIFIKRMLQRELPEKLRNIITSRLFNKYVSEDEKAFARKLYMSMDQLKLMRKKGMHVGSHGWHHLWLNTLSKKEQEKEIKLSLNFLKKVGCDVSRWVMSYPYGAYDDSLIYLLKKLGCKISFSTETGIVNPKSDNPLAYKRLDTNDLPKDKNAKPNKWTRQIP